jgi:uncharacterized integral membrane protein
MSTEPAVPATPATPSAASKRARMSAGGIASLTGLGALGVFMLQNREQVTLTFLFWDFTWPLWLLMLVTAVLGSIIWVGFGIVRRHRRRVARRNA